MRTRTQTLPPAFKPVDKRNKCNNGVEVRERPNRDQSGQVRKTKQVITPEQRLKKNLKKREQRLRKKNKMLTEKNDALEKEKEAFMKTVSSKIDTPTKKRKIEECAPSILSDFGVLCSSIIYVLYATIERIIANSGKRKVGDKYVRGISQTPSSMCLKMKAVLKLLISNGAKESLLKENNEVIKNEIFGPKNISKLCDSFASL